MSDNEAIKPPSITHNNSDLTVYACYLAGGYERWLDVEELYLKMFELAPNRLGWRTRSDLPDYKKCAKALQELEDLSRARLITSQKLNCIEINPELLAGGSKDDDC